MKKKEIIKSIKWILEQLEKTPEEYIDSWNARHDNLQWKLQYDDYFPFILNIVKSELKWIVKEEESEMD